MKRWVLVSAMSCAAMCRAQAGGYVVLPAGAVKEAGQQCSRGAPRVQGAWQPGMADIAGLERNLAEIAKLQAGWTGHPVRIEHPEKYFRQYVGVVVDERRLIYVNAGTERFSGRDAEHVAQVCDGGAAFWGVLYDPATGAFRDLEVNGGFG